jgi:hypothetical protein
MPKAQNKTERKQSRQKNKKDEREEKNENEKEPLPCTFPSAPGWKSFTSNSAMISKWLLRESLSESGTRPST